MDFEHEEVCRVVELRGDAAALGAAVTVALCGHWDHEGPCRWPHHTTTEVDGSLAVAQVRFDAPDHEVAQVRTQIRRGLATGSLRGPDGGVTTWQVL